MPECRNYDPSCGDVVCTDTRKIGVTVMWVVE
jgi:hypothetical protein